jgi:hypothetical protein
MMYSLIYVHLTVKSLRFRWDAILDSIPPADAPAIC